MGSLRRVTFSFRWQSAYWATLIGLGMAIAGFGMLLLPWPGTAQAMGPPFQLPYAASGGLAGLGLVGLGMALLNLQVTRHLAARERVHARLALRQATDILTRARRIDPRGTTEDATP